MSKLSISYMNSETKLTMQFLADIVKKMNEKNLITKNDLYNLSEEQVIKKIENCKYENISKCFEIWKNTTQINESDNPIEDKYCVSINAKRRYINPLVKENDQYKRISDISDIAKKDIKRCLEFKTKKYLCFNVNF